MPTSGFAEPVGFCRLPFCVEKLTNFHRLSVCGDRYSCPEESCGSFLILNCFFFVVAVVCWI